MARPRLRSGILDSVFIPGKLMIPNLPGFIFAEELRLPALPGALEEISRFFVVLCLFGLFPGLNLLQEENKSFVSYPLT